MTKMTGIEKVEVSFKIKKIAIILTIAGIVAAFSILSTGAVQAQQLVNSKFITGVTNKEWTGVAFVNNSEKQGHFQVIARDSLGKTLSSKAVTLSPNAQFCDLITNAQAQDFNGSVEIKSLDGNQFNIIAINGDRTTDYLRSDLASSGSTRLKIPHTTELDTWATNLSITNTTGNATTLKYRLLNKDGDELFYGDAPSLGPNQTLNWRLDDVLTSLNISERAKILIDIEASNPVVANAVYGRGTTKVTVNGEKMDNDIQYSIGVIPYTDKVNAQNFCVDLTKPHYIIVPKSFKIFNTNTKKEVATDNNGKLNLNVSAGNNLRLRFVHPSGIEEIIDFTGDKKPSMYSPSTNQLFSGTTGSSVNIPVNYANNTEFLQTITKAELINPAGQVVDSATFTGTNLYGSLSASSISSGTTNWKVRTITDVNGEGEIATDRNIRINGTGGGDPPSPWD